MRKRHDFYITLEDSWQDIREDILSQTKAIMLKELLYKHKGNKGKVAEQLRVSPNTIWRWLNDPGQPR